MNAGINIDPLYCVVADFKVRLPPVMWSQDTRCSASLYISISPLLSGAKICMSYILAIPFLPINSDTAVLKINHFLSWSLPSWKFPVSFYLFLFPSLLFSLYHLSPLIFFFFLIPWHKMQPSVASLQQLFKLLQSRFNLPVTPHCCNPKLGKYTFTHRIKSRVIFLLLVLVTVYTYLSLFSHCNWQPKSGFVKRGFLVRRSHQA